jgi:RDD family
LTAITILAAALGGIFNSGDLALLVLVILGFILLAGYFLVSEAVWNGQTLGKRSVRLRVVGDHGEPLSLGQSAIRNLVRIVDFLPVFYGIGMLTLFINGRGKRLGDFAAGTLVVRDKQRISLYDLSSVKPDAVAAPAPTTSIWSTPATPAAAVPNSPAAPLTLEPGLRRLVVAYAARREQLPMARRQALAQSAEPALQRVLPDVVATAGPLAALDQITPHRPMHRGASAAMTWGVATLAFFWMPLIAVPTGVMSIVFGTNAIRAIRSEPSRYQGDDRAKTGRLLGIIGLAITSVLLLLFIISLILRG